MSLVIAICALAPLVGSATLVAVIWTVGIAGRSVGAEYWPLADMTPSELDPPATPFTNHVTCVFSEPVTVAENDTVFPSRTLPLDGVTATLTEAGGAGGPVTEVVPPPPHPTVPIKVRVGQTALRATRCAHQPNRFAVGFALDCVRIRVRGRMPRRIAGESPPGRAEPAC